MALRRASSAWSPAPTSTRGPSRRPWRPSAAEVQDEITQVGTSGAPLPSPGAATAADFTDADVAKAENEKHGGALDKLDERRAAESGIQADDQRITERNRAVLAVSDLLVADVIPATFKRSPAPSSWRCSASPGTGAQAMTPAATRSARWRSGRAAGFNGPTSSSPGRSIWPAASAWRARGASPSRARC